MTIAAATKTCARCEDEKPLGDFYKHARSPDGHQYWCKECSRTRSLEWREEDDREELLEAAPFAAWLEGVMERDGTSIVRTAKRLGIGEGTMRRILKGRSVQLDTVDRVLIADNTITLRELYPSVYWEAA